MDGNRTGILIVGGSGYLGRFLIDHFARDPTCRVACTYHSNAPLLPVDLTNGDGSVSTHQVDLETGSGLRECLEKTKPRVICNCAAISQPALCEKDIHKATSINVPSKLVDAVLEMRLSRPPLLIHVSTDQVYDGTRGHWREDDPCGPVNAYGISKLQSEEYVRNFYPNHVILRSSIIFGSALPAQWPEIPDSRPLFTQFIDTVLSAEQPTTFFSDEYRNPIYVKDICSIVHHLVSREMDGSPQSHETLNMGGPERLSRVDMAMIIAEIRGYNKDCIIPAKSADVLRPYVSPPDISMNSSLLINRLSITPRDFKTAMRDVFSQ